MAVTVVGLLEADLPGGIEYKTGGIGPLFGQVRTEEPMELDELLSRIGEVLKKTGLKSVVSAFVDETEAYVDEDAEDDNLQTALDVIRDNFDLEAANGIYLMLSHEDEKLSHIITVEASVDHPADEATLSILDTARIVDGAANDEDDEDDEEEERDDEEEVDEESTFQPFRQGYDVSGGPLQPIEDDVTYLDESSPEVEALVEEFLQKVLGALEKELGVTEPEIDVWTDWQGEYSPESRLSTSMPGGVGA